MGMLSFSTPRKSRWQRMHDRLILLLGIETGTGFVDGGAELVMTEDLRLRIIEAKLTEQGKERTFLRPSAGIGGMALQIQASLVADADAMPVPAKGMRPYLTDRTTGLQRPSKGNVKMIADVFKASGEMRCPHILHREGTVATGGAAMNDQEAHLPVRLIKTTTLVCHKPQALSPNTPAMAVATAIITLRTVPQIDFFINYSFLKM